jgi:hypothetical protein
VIFKGYPTVRHVIKFVSFQICNMDSQVQIEGRLLDIVTEDWKKEK